VFVANAMDVALANCGVFTQQHAHDAKVALAQYRRPMGSHPLSIVIWIAHSLY